MTIRRGGYVAVVVVSLIYRCSLALTLTSMLLSQAFACVTACARPKGFALALLLTSIAFVFVECARGTFSSPATTSPHTSLRTVSSSRPSLESCSATTSSFAVVDWWFQNCTLCLVQDSLTIGKEFTGERMSRTSAVSFPMHLVCFGLSRLARANGC